MSKSQSHNNGGDTDKKQRKALTLFNNLRLLLQDMP